MFRSIDYDALGREFRPRKPLSKEIRRIVDLYLSGEGRRAILRAVRVTHGGVYIIRKYQTYTYGRYSPFIQYGNHKKDS